MTSQCLRECEEKFSGLCEVLGCSSGGCLITWIMKWKRAKAEQSPVQLLRGVSVAVCLQAVGREGMCTITPFH